VVFGPIGRNRNNEVSAAWRRQIKKRAMTKLEVIWELKGGVKTVGHARGRWRRGAREGHGSRGIEAKGSDLIKRKLTEWEGRDRGENAESAKD